MTQSPYDNQQPSSQPNPYGSQQNPAYEPQNQYNPQSGYGQQDAYGAPGAYQPQPGAELPPQAFGEGSASYWRATDDEKTMGWVAHLLGLLTSFVGPLILFLVKKDDSAFVRHHAAQSLNLQIWFAIIAAVSFVLMFVLIGYLTYFAAWIAVIVFEIMALVTATKGQGYKIPLLPALVK